MSKTLTKEQLKTPDEFLTWGTRFAIFAEKNLILVSTAAIALLVAAGGVFAMDQHRDQLEVEASGKLYEGEKKLNEEGQGSLRGLHIPGMSEPKPEDLQAALAAFRTVATDYPGSRAERRAHLLAGDTAVQLKDYDGAVKEYDAAVGGSGDIERYYALSGKAHALEEKQAWDDAAGAYRTIVADKSLLNRDIAELDLTRVLVRAGKADEAKGLLSKFGTDFPNSAVKVEADSRLTELGGDPAAAAASPAASSTPDAD